MTIYQRPNPKALSLADVLEGLSEKDIELIFAMILTLKHQRTQRTATASVSEEIDVKIRLFVRLLRSFMDLWRQKKDKKLISKLENWFLEMDCEPSPITPPERFPADTWALLFEGLESELSFTLVRLVQFLKEENLAMHFGGRSNDIKTN
jgi:hypothetical protein